MLKSILIGLDGSAYAYGAMELGFRWGRQLGAMLVGIGVVDEPGICKPRMVPIGGASYKQHADEVRLQQARDQVAHFLEEFAVRCMDAGVVSKLLEDEGLPYEQILLEAQRYDVILLGQHTFFHFATQDACDNTLWNVLKSTPCPVVVAPEKIGDGTCVVAAYDGSLQAARALHAFEASGLAANRQVHLVGVGNDIDQATAPLLRAKDFLSLHGVEANVRPIVSSASPADVLLEQSASLNAELLVMGSHGQPAMREFFLGSVTRTVLDESKKPLFLFH